MEVDEQDDIDVIDSIRAKQKLNASQLTYVIDLFINAYADKTTPVSLIDPGFLALYMKEKEAGKNHATMMRFFKGDKAKPITIIPIHDKEHWSLVVYLSRHTTFFYFDSLEEFHVNYVTRFINKLVFDNIVTDLENTMLTTIVSEQQAYSYECGQYVFMFLSSLFILYNNTRPTNKGPRFEEQLQAFVKESCREKHRQSFIRTVIEWVHESRGY